jgi:hypothetical protein
MVVAADRGEKLPIDQDAWVDILIDVLSSQAGQVAENDEERRRVLQLCHYLPPLKRKLGFGG